MSRRAAVAGVCLILLGCRAPWTVRSLQDVEAASSNAAPFDAARFVDSIWRSQVAPAAARGEDFLQWRAQGMTRPGLVQGQGSVVRVDSPAQLLLLAVASRDGQADAAVRFAGIHGTALRDALPFVQFSQFVNQVDFARASNALNARAAELAVQALGNGIAPGTLVHFAGVAIAPVEGALPEVIPIMLSRESAK
jgi:predicted lipoprotein